MDQEKIANLIKTIREENNLTQKDLGDDLGVSAQAVSKWENGKNIPDIAVLKEISDKYNIDINDLLDGENIKTKRSLLPIIVIGILLLLVIYIFIMFVNNNNNSFNSNALSSSCSEFKLQGIVSYNSSKSSISISKVEYCGNKDDKVYKSITCNLYERTNNTNKVISSCDKKDDITLDDYLKELSFNIVNYEQSCKKYKSDTLRLEIVATDKEADEKFVVPLHLDERC